MRQCRSRADQKTHPGGRDQARLCHRSGLRRAESPASRRAGEHRHALESVSARAAERTNSEIGQARDEVRVLNLGYAGTVEDVYAALSSRFGDIFSVLGQSPDAFEDEWTKAVLRIEPRLKISQKIETTKPPMELTQRGFIFPRHR